jgi:hypothetical protein
MATN